MAVKPDGRGPEIFAIYTLFLTLTSIATFLRIYCRGFVIKQFVLQDWLAVLSWAFFVSYASCAIIGIYHGTGQHAWNIHPPSEIVIGLKWWWMCEPTYVLSNMAIKGSIAIMLLRLVVKPIHRLIIWVAIIVTEVYSLVFFLLFIFQCTPSAYFWTRFANGTGTCITTSAIVGAVYAYSVIVCITDWTFSILPFVVVWNLENIPRREKIMVGIILAMSAVASIATIARFPYVHTLADKADFLYATADVAIWSCVETGLAITACSSATLRPLFRQFLGQSRLSSKGRSGSAVSDLVARPSKRASNGRPFHEIEHGDADGDVIHLSQRPKSGTTSGVSSFERQESLLDMLKDTNGGRNC